MSSSVARAVAEKLPPHTQQKQTNNNNTNKKSRLCHTQLLGRGHTYTSGSLGDKAVLNDGQWSGEVDSFSKVMGTEAQLRIFGKNGRWSGMRENSQLSVRTLLEGRWGRVLLERSRGNSQRWNIGYDVDILMGMIG